MTARDVISLDAASLQVRFMVHWFGLLRVRGSFSGISGRATLDATGGDLEVDVAATTVRTGIALRDLHLRRPRFLDAGRCPTIAFRGQVSLHGEGAPFVGGVLRLRGRDYRLPPTPILIVGRDDPLARWSVTFDLPRQPFGIGVASGWSRFNPLLWAIGGVIEVRVVAFQPASALRTGEPVLARER